MIWVFAPVIMISVSQLVIMIWVSSPVILIWVSPPATETVVRSGKTHTIIVLLENTYSCAHKEKQTVVHTTPPYFFRGETEENVQKITQKSKVIIFFQTRIFVLWCTMQNFNPMHWQNNSCVH